MIFISVLFALFALPALADLGDGLWRTFGHQTALPLSAADATKDGWKAVSSCDSNLGVLYAQSKSGPSEKHPLGLRFTSGGQIAGVQVTVYGENAAPDNLIKLGYWKTANATKTWAMDVSFRSSEEMCSDALFNSLMGDRVIINQDTIAYSIPLTVAEAQARGFTPGSCMTSMGWHHFYDLSSSPDVSYAEDQLLPVVPMYNPPDASGVLNAFFFASPVPQPGSSLWYLLTGAADWESPALPSSLMCENFCDDDACHWDVTWATMHIYLSSEWEELTCPGGSGPVGRSCTMV